MVGYAGGDAINRIKTEFGLALRIIGDVSSVLMEKSSANREVVAQVLGRIF